MMLGGRSEGSNRPVYFLLVSAGILLSGAGAILFQGFKPVQQPIAFNHKLHVGDLGAECADCHLYAVTGVRATIPNTEVCADCHMDAQTDSAEEARLVEYIAAGEVIPWRKIYRVPEDVYFSHRRHAGIGEIECQTCHGAVAESERPVSRPAVRISMDGCIECHEEMGASNDCLHCHR
jgi:hypothetical protein